MDVLSVAQFEIVDWRVCLIPPRFQSDSEVVLDGFVGGFVR